MSQMSVAAAVAELLTRFAESKPDEGAVRTQDARYAQYHNAEVAARTKADQAGRETSTGEFWLHVARQVAEQYHDGAYASKEEARRIKPSGKEHGGAGVGAPALVGLSS